MPQSAWADGGADAEVDGEVEAAPPPPGCVPKTCVELGFDCGSNADGCGGVLQCGMCTAPAFCGGGGYSRCGGAGAVGEGGAPPPVCVPRTCQGAGVSCGIAADGCGGVLSCGPCVPDAASGTPDAASGTPDAASGTPHEGADATMQEASNGEGQGTDSGRAPGASIAWPDAAFDAGETGTGAGPSQSSGGCTIGVGRSSEWPAGGDARLAALTIAAAWSTFARRRRRGASGHATT